MADLKISQLTGASTPLAGTEVLPIVQSSSTKKVATDDLTVKNVRSNATTGILQVAGPAAAATRTMTVPDANFTAARTDAAQSFTGDQTLSTGNLIQGTAAKGFNFTANTPAAGMTSQLLNWYEEGTFTPTFDNLTIGNGTVWGSYVRNGKIVQVTLGFTWGSTSSIAGTIGDISGLPFSVQAPNGQSFPLVVGSVYKAGTGWFNIVSVLTGTSLVATTTFAGTGISSTSPAAFAANDSLTISATYRAA